MGVPVLALLMRLLREVGPRSGSGCRFPNDEFGGEFDAVGVQGFSGRQPIGGSQRDAAHVRERLADGGQRWRCPTCRRQVVEADDAEMVRNSHVPHPCCLDQAEGLEIAGGEHRGRARLEREQFQSMLVGNVVAEVPVSDERRVGRDACRIHGGVVAMDPGTGAQGVWPASYREAVA